MKIVIGSKIELYSGESVVVTDIRISVSELMGQYATITGETNCGKKINFNVGAIKHVTNEHLIKHYKSEDLM